MLRTYLLKARKSICTPVHTGNCTRDYEAESKAFLDGVFHPLVFGEPPNLQKSGAWFVVPKHE